MKFKVISFSLFFAIFSLLSIPTISTAEVLNDHYCVYNVGQDLSPAKVPQNYKFVSELHELDVEMDKHGDPSKSFSWTAPKGCRARTTFVFHIARPFWESSLAARRAVLSKSRIRQANRAVDEALAADEISVEEAELITELIDARRGFCVLQITESFVNLKSAQSKGPAKRRAAQARKNDVIKGCSNLKQDILEFFSNALGADI